MHLETYFSVLFELDAEFQEQITMLQSISESEEYADFREVVNDAISMLIYFHFTFKVFWLKDVFSSYHVVTALHEVCSIN